MKKFLSLLLIISITLPVNAGLFKRKDKALEAELQGKGYAGSLPNLNNKLEPIQQKVTTPIFDTVENFSSPSDLKPTPSDNPSFINIIQKKDKTSQYVNDAIDIIRKLEKVADSIESEESVQLFISKANVLTMTIDHLINKYNNKPEYYYESFRKLQEVNGYTKTLMNLRKEAVTYERYLAYQTTGSIYNPENINQQLQYLLEEINSAILLLKEET